MSSLHKYHIIILLLFLNSYKVNGDISVEFRLFANEDPVNYQEISSTDLGSFSYDPSLYYFLMCHGYNANINDPLYLDIENAFMKHPNYVVIACGYGAAVSSPIYTEAAANAPEIGVIIGQLLVTIHQEKGVPTEQFEMEGHSLGAHVAGFAGDYLFQQTGYKLYRIFGLDPVAEGFENPPSGLKKEDSLRTVVLHTSAIGVTDPRGHLDFYPYNGLNQGSCGALHYGDHSVVCWYFSCSINEECENPFIGDLCSDYQTFLLNGCSTAPSALMGYWVSDNAPDGNYYLNPDCSPKTA